MALFGTRSGRDPHLPFHSRALSKSHQSVRGLTFLKAFNSFLGSYSIQKSEAYQAGDLLTLTLRQSLESGQGLPSIPLLDTNMDVLVGPDVRGGLVERVPFVSKGICEAILGQRAPAPRPLVPRSGGRYLHR